MKLDFVIKNGHVVDPAQNIDRSWYAVKVIISLRFRMNGNAIK